MQSIVAFILIFSIIVIFHEFGHFYFAKRANILVREFSIGMGPKIYHYQGDETTYTLRLLPIGGYVRMAGLDEMSETIERGMQLILETDRDGQVETISLATDQQNYNGLPIEVFASDLENEMFIEGIPFGQTEVKRFPVSRTANLIEADGTIIKVAPSDRQFQSASIWQRMLTNFAGPMNNFILAVLAFILLGFFQGGVPTNDPVIGDVVDSSPAAQVGLQVGDQITEIAGQSIDSFAAIGDVVSNHPKEELALTYQRDGKEHSITVTPTAAQASDGSQIGQLGVTPSQSMNPLTIIAAGFQRTWAIIAMVFAVIGSMVKNGFDINNFGGPVYMYQATSQVVSMGWLGLLSWLGALSVNLGIVNLLPIPALDGGKLVLNLIELVRGKPLSHKVEAYINIVGVVLVFLLMIAVTWNDIMRFFG